MWWRPSLGAPEERSVVLASEPDRSGSLPVAPSRHEERRPKGPMGTLTPEQRLAEQGVTLATPRRPYSLAARLLFATLDAVYGKDRTMSKLKVLELVARVPYQAWEQVSYIAITHTQGRTELARRIHDRVVEARAQQDNEQWHLLILNELVDQRGIPEDRLHFTVLPQVLAFIYYQLSWVLFIIRPAWSYRLNASFEDHAEHEYMELVKENPEWENEPFETSFAHDYGTYASLADLFRQIGYDERVHKEESVTRMAEPRFS
ncbi:MAG: hypothetical protein DLM54_07005 [Acidimicrobiales bacterium]|nr:MAG: hypothetical protein DLM54_07005 [Acidimicrobiales bacterium]